jgi:hypothetical protein
MSQKNFLALFVQFFHQGLTPFPSLEKTFLTCTEETILFVNLIFTENLSILLVALSNLNRGSDRLSNFFYSSGIVAEPGIEVCDSMKAP